MEEIKTAAEALGSQIKALTGRVAAIPEGVTPDAFEKASGAMEKRLDAIEARLGGPGEVRGAASAIALADLRRIIDQGQPFQAELSAFSSLVPDDPVVSVLKPHAESGLKTRAQLLAGFRSAAEPPRETGKDKSEAPDLTGAILSRLQKVVQVKRTGDGDGNDAGAVAARMGKAVSAGDLEGAIARGGEASEALPVGLKTWIESAKAPRRSGQGDGRGGSTDACRTGTQRRLTGMWRAIAIFIGIAIFAAGLAWFADRPGSLTLTWLGYEIQTTFLFASAVIALFNWCCCSWPGR